MIRVEGCAVLCSALFLDRSIQARAACFEPWQGLPRHRRLLAGGTLQCRKEITRRIGLSQQCFQCSQSLFRAVSNAAHAEHQEMLVVKTCLFSDRAVHACTC